MLRSGGGAAGEVGELAATPRERCCKRGPNDLDEDGVKGEMGLGEIGDMGENGGDMAETDVSMGGGRKWEEEVTIGYGCWDITGVE